MAEVTSPVTSWHLILTSCHEASQDTKVSGDLSSLGRHASTRHVNDGGCCDDVDDDVVFATISPELTRHLGTFVGQKRISRWIQAGEFVSVLSACRDDMLTALDVGKGAVHLGAPAGRTKSRKLFGCFLMPASSISFDIRPQKTEESLDLAKTRRRRVQTSCLYIVVAFGFFAVFSITQWRWTQLNSLFSTWVESYQTEASVRSCFMRSWIISPFPGTRSTNQPCNFNVSPIRCPMAHYSPTDSSCEWVVVLPGIFLLFFTLTPRPLLCWGGRSQNEARGGVDGWQSSSHVWLGSQPYLANRSMGIFAWNFFAGVSSESGYDPIPPCLPVILPASCFFLLEKKFEKMAASVEGVQGDGFAN